MTRSIEEEEEIKKITNRRQTIAKSFTTLMNFILADVGTNLINDWKSPFHHIRQAQASKELVRNEMLNEAAEEIKNMIDPSFPVTTCTMDYDATVATQKKLIDGLST